MGTAPTRLNKASKLSLVARAICEHGLDARTPVALARDLAQVTQGRLGVDLDEPARAGAPWQLRVTHKVW